MTPQTSGVGITLEPGESVVLWEDVDLTRLFLLSEEKDYFVLAEGGEWAMQAVCQDSNRVQVEPAGGELPPVQKLIVDLLGQVPDGWKISSGYGAVFLSLQPTNLKADATTIQLVFLDEEGEQRLADSQRRSGDALTALGPTVLGNAFLLAPGKASSLWSEYRETVGQSVKKILGAVQPDEQSDDNSAADQAPNRPWSVSGTVTDADGKAIEGATVKAFCGIGSLHNTGSGITDDQGHYQFRFGPGILGGDPNQVQAATISVFLDGFTERNLHRQGDCMAALERPDEISWGDRTEEHLFLPDQPRVINFAMVPASRMQGRLFRGDTGNPAAGHKVSLTGPELPPSASVIDQVTVGDDGKFEIVDIPTGFPFQILVEPNKRGAPWNGWASPPMVFVAGDGGTHIKHVHDGQPVDFSFQFLNILVHGEGVNWKQALADAAEKPLALTWDGLSTDQMISAGVAFLELGK